jgi:hypothetical protein
MENKTKYDQKQYNATYYEKHKKESIKCDICDGKYSVMNKSHHIHSKKHIKKLEERKTPQNNDIINNLIAKSIELGIKIEIKDNVISIG